jgi:hypothetical protein
MLQTPGSSACISLAAHKREQCWASHHVYVIWSRQESWPLSSARGTMAGARRGVSNKNGMCFGCRLGAYAIQHYAACSCIHNFRLRRFRLPEPPTLSMRSAEFLLLGPLGGVTDDELACRALLVAAAYRVHCGARHGPLLRGNESATRALAHSIREAVLGHPRAMWVLDFRWATGRGTGATEETGCSTCESPA